MDPSLRSVPEVLRELESSETGLSGAEAARRLSLLGPNVIEAARRVTAFSILLDQFKSPLVWVLFVAVGISVALKEWADVVLIVVIIVLNAILGFIQEYKAEQAIELLQRLLSPKARVLRDGQEREIPAEEVVPGDILVLEAGDRVPADARLIKVVELSSQESELTGESVPVHKDVLALPRPVEVADRSNMVFAGTAVVDGRGIAVVTATGMNTEMGRIASLLHEAVEDPSPLQRQIAVLSRLVAAAVVAIALVVLFAGWLQGRPFAEMLVAAIALAVAAIPEGLPAVVTITLALGVRRMAQHNALVRKLPSVETLGACTVICADKTGTLTHNEMTVRKVYANGVVASVSGSGYAPAGQFSQRPDAFNALLLAGVLCNNAKLMEDALGWRVIGDPTEGALLVSARKAGIIHEKVQVLYSRVSEVPFTSARKLMSTVHQVGKKRVSFTKGALEAVLPLCDSILVDGQVRHLSVKDREAIRAQHDALAASALRVLAFARGEVSPNAQHPPHNSRLPMPNAPSLTGLVFLGLQAMMDPPRQDARDAVRLCHDAGIKVVMITGDHAATASAVAKELDIPGRTVTGVELGSIPDLASVIGDIGVFARVNPEHKLRIIEALKARGHVVAMTGDGVNDAPALKRADLGIAMGSGTDVAKDASDMVLADDSFASIVRAVEEGRRVFANIRKFVEYLFSSNLGEVLAVFVATVVGWPLPVLARQLLWVNLMTDLFPALALSVDPADVRVMRQPPRRPGEPIVRVGDAVVWLLVGGVMAAGTLFVFDLVNFEVDLVRAQTMAFSALVFYQLWNVLNVRSSGSVIGRSLFTNGYVWAAIALSAVLQVVVVAVPFFQPWFGTVSLSASEWVLAAGIGVSVVVFVEVVKFIRRMTVRERV